MPRIRKKSKIPLLPAEFYSRYASADVPLEWRFKIGDYVKHKGGCFEGWVCGSVPSTNDLIVYHPNGRLGINGIGTFTGWLSNWELKPCQE